MNQRHILPPVPPAPEKYLGLLQRRIQRLAELMECK
jgi:hypothetical protein